MDLESKYGSDDSNESENNDTDSISTSHLYVVQKGDPSGRGAGLNHNPDAYDLVKENGEVYKAFTKKGDGRKMTWSLSDTTSHILAAYEPLVEVFDAPPAGYAAMTRDLMNAVAEMVEGDFDAIMDFAEPDEAAIVDYVARSDDVSLSDIIDEAKERKEDADDDN